MPALLDLVLHLCVGRLCLSLSPPGWPGYHDRQELGATLAASLLLGTLGLTLVPWPWVWALVLLLRLAFLPGALRPRYATGRGSGLGWLGVAAVFAALWIFSHPDLRAPAAALGLFWMAFGWRTWRLHADRRARTLAWCALATLVTPWLL